MRLRIFLMMALLALALTSLNSFAQGIDHSPVDTVVLILPGDSFVNLTSDPWYALSRCRLETAVINTRALANCEKALKDADKRNNRNQWSLRIREGIIVALAAAYVFK